MKRKLLIYIKETNNLKVDREINFDNLTVDSISSLFEEIQTKNYERIFMYIEFNIWPKILSSSLADDIINFISGEPEENTENPYENIKIITNAWDELSQALSGGEGSDLPMGWNGHLIEIIRLSSNIETDIDFKREMKDFIDNYDVIHIKI